MAIGKMNCPVCKQNTVIFTTSDKVTTLYIHEDGTECPTKTEVKDEEGNTPQE